MNASEARDLFSEAFEGDLEEERKAAFDAALMEDEELDADYADFVETFQMMRGLADPESVQAPNLLPRIQERIRRRSGGKYYRDRFSKRVGGPGWTMPVIMIVAVLVVLGIAWFALQTTVMLEDGGFGGDEPADTTTPEPSAE